MGMLSITADLRYQQGLNRMFSRETRYDFYWPALSAIGEQSVLEKEIFTQDPAVDTGSTGTPDNEKTWGYIPRYDEYRYKPSIITGKMRSQYASSLDVWHCAEYFSTRPTLSDAFIQDNCEGVLDDRVVAVPSEPQFNIDIGNSLMCMRPMPAFGTPGLTDHF